ncbi:ABC-2 type transport system ATP-binding protein [Natranaerovirga pectinivora]|uniref:ABC-2 type transport system ATP-binding protein n=1 Tax=Natranaerovirga pectinivora TaxID=682400 RepID=A0A4R3MRU0_9FIRM|nr:ABC transporter ATP-binding protein [Natranaerovirga pectinivora]TCT16128.1 ABC-2 type transport system ATP-binding protein [Natranaerovirga pectinivora]
MLASIKNIVKRYGDTVVLDNVSFEINKGEVLGLLGPNGAGKTTTIRALAGLIGIDAGDILIFNDKQHVNNLNVKKRMGLVTQEVTVFDELTAEENLKFFGGLYGLKGTELKKRVSEALEFVGLTEHAKKFPKKFSGGMSRRLNIACALVHQPEFIIMDEPTVGIDPQSRNYILESVKRLAENGTTVLYTSHYMEEVQAISTRILIMDQGHIIAGGTLKELIKRIQHEEKINITVENPSEGLTEKFKSIQGVKNVIRDGSDYIIISGAGYGNLNRVLSVAQEKGGVSNISADKPTLEDVFLTLTGKNLRDEGEK